MQSNDKSDAEALLQNANPEPAGPKDPLTVLRALRDELRERMLRDVADFRIYVALEEAIQAVEEPQPDARKEHRSPGLRLAVRTLLDQHGPLGTRDIIRRLRAAGVPTSMNSVSSSLSQSAAFVNIRYQGRPHWWFANRPVPPRPAHAGRKKPASKGPSA
ncbi:hypothetical protein [Alsobacter sp. SYSU BS001988]